MVTSLVAARLDAALAKRREDLFRKTLDLGKLRHVTEATDEVVDTGRLERFEPLDDRVGVPDRSPVGKVDRLTELGVVVRDVAPERRARLLCRVPDVHRYLVRNDVAVEVGSELGRRGPQLSDLLDDLFWVRRPTARHPAVAIADDPLTSAFEAPSGDLLWKVTRETDVRNDPRRWRLLHRHQRCHLRAGMEGDVLVRVVLAAERDPPFGPKGAEHTERLFEDRGSVFEVEPEGVELAADTDLGVAHARAEDRASVREVVHRRPLESEIERIARRGDKASGADPHPGRALGERGHQGERLVAWFGEQAVANPDRVEADVLGEHRKIEKVSEVVVGCDQRLAVVEIDTEFHSGTSSLRVCRLDWMPANTLVRTPPAIRTQRFSNCQLVTANFVQRRSSRPTMLKAEAPRRGWRLWRAPLRCRRRCRASPRDRRECVRAPSGQRAGRGRLPS